MPAGANTGSGEVEPEALASGGLLWTRVSTVLRFAVGGLIKMEQRSCTAAKQVQFAAPFVAKRLTKAEYWVPPFLHCIPRSLEEFIMAHDMIVNNYHAKACNSA